MLDNGANVNTRLQDVGTALYMASEYGYETVVKQLLENGAEVNAQLGRHLGTALYMASRAGPEAMVKLLLGNGADVNRRQQHSLVVK